MARMHALSHTHTNTHTCTRTRMQMLMGTGGPGGAELLHCEIKRVIRISARGEEARVVPPRVPPSARLNHLTAAAAAATAMLLCRSATLYGHTLQTHTHWNTGVVSGELLTRVALYCSCYFFLPLPKNKFYDDFCSSEHSCERVSC